MDHGGFFSLPSGINFHGGAGGNDRMSVVGTGTTSSAYLPDGATPGNGVVEVNDGTALSTINFSGLEPVDVSNMVDVDFVSPNGADQLTITTATRPGNIVSNTIAGTSGGVGFESLEVYDIEHLQIDVASNDRSGSADDVILLSGNVASANLNDFTVLMGMGANLLNLDNSAIDIPGRLRVVGNEPVINLSGGAINVGTLDAPGGRLLGFGQIDTAVGDVAQIVNGSGTMQVGDGTQGAFNFGGSLHVADELVISDSNFANLGPVTVLDTGILTAAAGVVVGNGDSVSGSGAIDGRVAADVGSLITATGNLGLGDPASLSGFFSDGELAIDQHTVTIHDADEAVLGSLTTIGSPVAGGTLSTPNGLILEMGKSLGGRGTINNFFNNQGHVVGPTVPDQLEFTGLVKGIGTFNGNIHFSGTFSPGNSPARVMLGEQVTFSANSELVVELGGTAPGDEYDRLEIGDVANLIGGFQPQVGDQFEVLTFGSHVGDFTAYLGLDVGNGVRLEPELDNQRLILRAVALDQIAPQVASFGINTNEVDPADLVKGPQPTSWGQQRSDIRSIELEFSEPVTVTPADLRLTNLGVNAPVDLDSVVTLTNLHVQANGNTVSIQFSNQELAEGVYKLEVLPTVTDLAGNAWDGDGNGLAGEAFVVTGDSGNRFHLLHGNWNGDEGVSVFDFTTFSYWFGQPAIQVAPEYVDLNKDGGVSVFDFSPFSSNFGTPVIFPTPLAAARLPNANLATEEQVTAEPIEEREFAAEDDVLLDRLNDVILADWTRARLEQAEIDRPSRIVNDEVEAVFADDGWLEGLLAE
jgi:hypothetical protein